MLTAGAALRGTSASLAALSGHDRQSGIPTIGVDRMLTVTQSMGPFALTFYNYEGRRRDGGLTDAFRRVGYGAIVLRGRWESDTIVQKGTDSSFLGTQTAVTSSGGFSQLRYAFTNRLFGLVRFDALSDPQSGVTRAGTFLVGYRPRPNLRLTLEDDITRPLGAADVRQTHNDFVFQITAGY